MHPVFYLLAVIVQLVPIESRNYTVYRLTPITDQQIGYLRNQFQTNSNLDFWKAPSHKGSEVHVMVSSVRMKEFLLMSKKLGLIPKVMIINVERLISDNAYQSENERDAPRQLFDIPNSPVFNLAKYHSFAEIMHHLNDLNIQYPDRAALFTIGSTHEGRQIPLIKVGSNSSSIKPAIWIDGGIHAREWVSPASVLYMLNQLVTGYEWDTRMRQLVDDLDWYFVPVLNPDGYEYSRSSNHPNVRLWRKNRAPAVCRRAPHRLLFPSVCCQGVDLNRNFDWHWSETGSSADPCLEIYQGSAPFSEPETAAVRDFILLRRDSIKAFLTMHSYSQILMYPFGHQRQSYPPPYQLNQLRSTALDATFALKRQYGTNYVVGTGADTLSSIWWGGRLGAWEGKHVHNGFLLTEDQILPTSKETFEAIKVIADAVVRSKTVKTASRAAIISRPIAPMTDICRDSHPMCFSWTRKAACIVVPDLRKRCPRSCRVCNLTENSTIEKTRIKCADNRQDCAVLRKLDLCSYVTYSCKRTCGLCS